MIDTDTLDICMIGAIEFPKIVSHKLGETQYPFDLVGAVGDGFSVNRSLAAVRTAVNTYNRRHVGKRKFAVRFVDGKSLVKRIL